MRILTLTDIVAAIHTALDLEVPVLPSGEVDLSGRTREILLASGWTDAATAQNAEVVPGLIRLSSPSGLLTVHLATFNPPGGSCGRERWYGSIDLWKPWPESWSHQTRLSFSRWSKQFDQLPGIKIVGLSMWPNHTAALQPHELPSGHVGDVSPDPFDSPDVALLKRVIEAFGADHLSPVGPMREVLLRQLGIPNPSLAA